MHLRRILALVSACVLPVACASPSVRTEGGPTAPAARGMFDALPYPTWRTLGAPPTFTLTDAGGFTVLTGKGPIPSNGFLASPRELADFRLEVDVKLGSPDNPKGDKMNSGIQIRSQEKDGTVAGLQVEVDPTKRAWSGGVYDERGRAWLASLEGNEAARAAFRLGEWNHYEIECEGPRIRTRVNGVDCAVWYDGIVEGLLAFQVHGGPPCEVAFRGPVLTEFGRHSWRPIRDAAFASSGERVACSLAVGESARGVRVTVEGDGHVEVLAADGARMSDVSFATSAIAPAAPHRLELVWIDGAGAVLLDGRRVGALAFASPPARIRVLGGSCAARDASVLEKDAGLAR